APPRRRTPGRPPPQPLSDHSWCLSWDVLRISAKAGWCTAKNQGSGSTTTIAGRSIRAPPPATPRSHLLTHRLRASSLFESVTAGGSTARAAYLLRGEIERFEEVDEKTSV